MACSTSDWGGICSGPGAGWTIFFLSLTERMKLHENNKDQPNCRHVSDWTGWSGGLGGIAYGEATGEHRWSALRGSIERGFLLRGRLCEVGFFGGG